MDKQTRDALAERLEAAIPQFDNPDYVVPHVVQLREAAAALREAPVPAPVEPRPLSRMEQGYRDLLATLRYPENRRRYRETEKSLWQLIDTHWEQSFAAALTPEAPPTREPDDYTDRETPSFTPEQLDCAQRTADAYDAGVADERARWIGGAAPPPLTPAQEIAIEQDAHGAPVRRKGTSPLTPAIMHAKLSGAPSPAPSGEAYHLRSALRQAAIWFDAYAASHAAKGDDAKAQRNQERADFCLAALTAGAQQAGEGS